jgi:lipopolysaccharide export system permease protein
MHLMPPVLTRHLLGTFLRTTSLCLGAFLGIYLVVEFFDQFDAFLEQGAGTAAIAQYFLFRIPMIVTRVMPMAVLGGGLLGLGNLSRHNEFVALRAAGVSVWQLAGGLLVTRSAPTTCLRARSRSARSRERAGGKCGSGAWPGSTTSST